MGERTANYWLDIADYDLDTAEAMYQQAGGCMSPLCAIRL